MNYKSVVGLALVLFVVVPLMTTPMQGQDQGQVEKDANEIYNSLLSPFCPGRLIANCPSSQAADLRNQIRDQLRAGATKDEVVDELYATWGEEVLGGRRGPLSYGVPIGVIVLAGGLLVGWEVGSAVFSSRADENRSSGSRRRSFTTISASSGETSTPVSSRGFTSPRSEATISS